MAAPVDYSRLPQQYYGLARAMERNRLVEPHNVPPELMGRVPGTPAYPTTARPFTYYGGTWPPGGGPAWTRYPEWEQAGACDTCEAGQTFHYVETQFTPQSDQGAAWQALSEVLGLEYDPATGYPLETAANLERLGEWAARGNMTVEQLGAMLQDLWPQSGYDPVQYRALVQAWAADVATAEPVTTTRVRLPRNGVAAPGGPRETPGGLSTERATVPVTEGEKPKEDEDKGIPTWGWVVGGVGVVAIIGGGIYFATAGRRRRRRR